MPADTDTVIGWLCSYTGLLRAESVAKKPSALKWWHVANEEPFLLHPERWRACKRGIEREKPKGEEIRDEFTPQHLQLIRRHLDTSLPENAAIWCAITFSFFAKLRFGHIVHEPLNSCHHEDRASGGCWQLHEVSNTNPYAYLELHLPFDKVRGAKGQTFRTAQQPIAPELCPIAAFHKHVTVNGISPNRSASSYRNRAGTGFRDLTRNFALSTINTILIKHGHERLTGHGFRYGGATFYLAVSKVTVAMLQRNLLRLKSSLELARREEQK